MNKVVLASTFAIASSACNKDAPRCESWAVLHAFVVTDSNCGGSSHIYTDTGTFCGDAIRTGMREGDTLAQSVLGNGCFITYEVWLKRIK